MSAPVELAFEVKEMPPDGTLCFVCKEPIYGKMFQWFLVDGREVTATKFKECESCFKE